jgi:hypothetical protein
LDGGNDAEQCAGEQELFEAGQFTDGPTESAALWAVKDWIRLGHHRILGTED